MIGYLFAIVIASFSACDATYNATSVEYDTYKVDTALARDSELVRLIRPYADSVHSRMSGVIANAAFTLTRETPESTLGNLVVDAMLEKGRETFSGPVNGAVMNYGGIRLNTLAKGDITLGKVFELAPFDNTLVLLHVPGSVLQQWCDHISALKGWPVAGLSWQIINNKAVGLSIQGQPVEPNKIYNIITNDYVANGGDDCDMLRPLPRETNGYLLRDALISYLKEIDARGQQVSPTIKNRIKHAD